MTELDYWRECLSNAAEDAGLKLSDEHLEALAFAAKCGHEGFGMAFYSPPGGEYLMHENSKLQRALRYERRKVGCDRCNGRGYITESFGPIGRSTTSQCSKCGGEGKVVA